MKNNVRKVKHFVIEKCPICKKFTVRINEIKTKVTFAQWGNSLAVRIPRKVAEKYKLTSGKQGLLLAEKEGIRIIPQA